MTRAEAARLGGKSTSAKKAEASRRNGAMPRKDGKQRGWEKGRKRGPRKKSQPPTL